jgi:hypothetical protein
MVNHRTNPSRRIGPMKRRRGFASGQFCLPLDREAGVVLDERTRTEVVDTLASLLLEALGDDDAQEREKEAERESENHR